MSAPVLPKAALTVSVTAAIWLAVSLDVRWLSPPSLALCIHTAAVHLQQISALGGGKLLST